MVHFIVLYCVKNIFFISMIAFTIFEYVVSVVLESLFGLRWWTIYVNLFYKNYSSETLNCNNKSKKRNKF